MVLLITAGLHVPGTAGVLDELFGSAGTGDPEQIVNEFDGNALKTGVGAGVTVTLSVPVVAQAVAVGVKVYVPLVVLLIVAGLHVPAKPSIEVGGKVGAVVPAQNGAMALNVGATLLITLTLIVTGVAETHCPAVGTKVLVFMPVVVVLIVVGFHVPVNPLVEVGNAGADAFWQRVAG